MKAHKSMQPQRGDRAQLRYGRTTRAWVGLHEACGSVIEVMKGRRVGELKAPSNYALVLDGEAVPRVIPWGQIYHEPGAQWRSAR